MMALALLLLCAPDAGDATVVDISGDVDVSISYDSQRLAAGAVEVSLAGQTFTVKANGEARAKISFGAPNIEKLIVHDRARVVLESFTGKALHIVASGGAVVVVRGQNTRTLIVHGAGTSRVDAEGLAVEDAEVILKDAARAATRASKSLTCDLKKASRLVVTGKPARVDKKLAGVAKLDLR